MLVPVQGGRMEIRMKTDLSFIKKTGISADVKPIGLGKNKRKLTKKSDRMPVLLKNPYNIIKSIYNGDTVYRKDFYLNYKYSFNYKTGLYKRSDYLDEMGMETGKDVFAANFPHLIDVGIMGHCTHGRSGLCVKTGVQCYQNGLSVNKPNMTIENFKRIAEECNGLTNQFALGGRGDPNEHEDFEKILQISRENNIIPNYTTSGFNLTDKQIALSKKYCGAVAISWYRSPYTISSIKRLIESDIKTNIHFVLNNDTIDEAIYLLENDKFPDGINAVIFLTHKPVGLGKKEKCIKYDDERVQKIYSLIKNKKYRFKIGVDGCFVVGMLVSDKDFNMKYLDTCEAARFTCYIDSQMHMKPCSFDVENKYAIDINNTSIIDAWNSPEFVKIRETLLKGCPNCDKNEICHGGCFLHKDIVLCPNKI